MRAPKRRSPAGQGVGFDKTQTMGRGLHFDYTLQAAAVQTLERELAIILAAADRMAGGYGLAWDDHERLHKAHQFLIRILAGLRGREVLQ